MNDAETILHFWFGPLADDAAYPAERARLWFNGGPEFDAAINKNFGADVDRAKTGELDGWAKAPRGRLALILLLDQFTRNIFRDGRAFESDRKALALALEGVRLHMDQKLRPVERLFFYMPFQHVEDLKMQEEGVRLYGALTEASPPAIQIVVGESLAYMERHAAIIRRFGRFPHRNAVLGRDSSAEELEFLKEPGSSF